MFARGQGHTWIEVLRQPHPEQPQPVTEFPRQSTLRTKARLFLQHTINFKN